MKSKIKLLSNILFYFGILISAYGYYKIWEVKSKLPEGVCPITDNRWILILGLGIIIVSVVADWIANKFNLCVKEIND